jgi:hypothetical protein
MFLAVRAVGVEFARRLWQASLVTTLWLLLGFVLIEWWLVTLSVWWWLFAVVIASGATIALVLLFVFKKTMNHVRPKQTNEQRQMVRTFVDKVQGAADFFGTPKFIILFRVIRSVAAPRSDSYLADIMSTKDLKSDFSAIMKTFRNYKA